MLRMNPLRLLQLMVAWTLIAIGVCSIVYGFFWFWFLLPVAANRESAFALFLMSFTFFPIIIVKGAVLLRKQVEKTEAEIVSLKKVNYLARWIMLFISVLPTTLFFMDGLFGGYENLFSILIFPVMWILGGVGYYVASKKYNNISRQ